MVELPTTAGVRMADMQVRFNHKMFMKFYQVEKRPGTSERQLAQQIGISHTQLQNLRKGSEDGRPKKFVNLETARRIESAWGIPKELVFLPEAVDGRSTAA